MRRNLSVLVKPASSACNLRCRYCFYEDVSRNRQTASFGTMPEETMALLVSRIAEALQEDGTASVSFQGGEPTVAGLPWFRRFVSEMKKHPGIQVNYSMQTNAVMLNEEWARFLHENHFLTGVSLDGFQSNMDRFRMDASGNGVYYQVLNGIEQLRRAGAEFNILTVVTSALARHPEALLNFFITHHFDYVQLIPCLPGLEGEGSEMALTPALYASFYCRFYDTWEKEVRKGRGISVSLFENLAGVLLGKGTYQCGLTGRCTVQYIVEANGDLFPCDFYCLDEYRMGNIRDASFRELYRSEGAVRFLSGSSCEKTPCADCPYRSFCHGGCRRQNVCWLTEQECAYREVLDHVLPRLRRLIGRAENNELR